MERMMVGTGAASLDAAARLTRCAVDCGFVAALIMPPFFFRDALDDGIVHFFDALFSQVNPPPQGVLLYNFPRMSGITFHALLVDRLLREFPGIIAGMKDSSNDAALQTEVLSRHPKLSVFPGFEGDLLAAKARGAVGCISGSVSLWPRLARAAFIDEDETKAETLTKARNALDGVPFVPAMRYLTANLRRDPTWLRGMPPLMPVSDSQQRALDLAIEPFRGILG
jgi:4-hydroxy-tetrahydrodipicolinate synthase